MDKKPGQDNAKLQLLKSVADGIAALFFPCVEVVIHDVEAGKVAYIANNLSKRKPGDDAGLDGFQQDQLAPLTGPYEKLNWDGKKMRSVTISTGDENTRGYLLCINLSTAVFEEARNALEMFLSVTRLQPQPEQLFRDDWQENINTFLHEWLRRENTSLSALTREQKRELVQSLQSEGAFRAKNAAEYIAGVLSLGRTTVYKYLKECKK
ncbi:Transcriptional regulator DauR [Pantoea ananatis]|uniref:helix-turn-helix transcriptional regulator n=1 Tax=Pantoea ananas TaxID=553 RepID=UPI001FF4C513|nr:PAS domain-containing protein [Pantoea ananatis]MCK0553314.1 PAS domain-containing protein [Pantoea ananatis]MCW0317535.1 Transcriptional regulator DauR [Pantoea ananatis]MCW0335704.1 Transcriptional regulator DauR [Pantoea ananatis]MCW0383669.1 Transcriptional regulator DauR [Pantoea ananatis]MCW0408312.1 Transcriptional regulator DauR [Pantoea ananatis]